MLNVLLTNDDGIEAEGLRAMRAALAALPEVRLAVIAPDGNRSAMARSITTRRPLWVEEVAFPDGSVGYATDGTPVDCVRLASLGVVEGFEAEVVVSGINHGANLGDDITYSGTVAAALEGVVLGLPSIAVSQQSGARALDYRFHGGFQFEIAAHFVARLVERLEVLPLPASTLLNVNVPAGHPTGVEVTRLGKRIYRDELKLEREEAGPPRAGATGSTATTPASTTSPAPTSPPWPPGRSPSPPCISTSPTDPGWRRSRTSTCTASSPPPRWRPAEVAANYGPRRGRRPRPHASGTRRCARGCPPGTRPGTRDAA